MISFAASRSVSRVDLLLRANTERQHRYSTTRGCDRVLSKRVQRADVVSSRRGGAPRPHRRSRRPSDQRLARSGRQPRHHQRRTEHEGVFSEICHHYLPRPVNAPSTNILPATPPKSRHRRHVTYPAAFDRTDESPPATPMTSPVTRLLASETNQVITWPTSSARPIRPSGWFGIPDGVRTLIFRRAPGSRTGSTPRTFTPAARQQIGEQL